MLDKLRKNFLKGHNNYPKTVLEVYRILLQYKDDAIIYSRNIKDMDAHSFSADRGFEVRKKKTPRGGLKVCSSQRGKSDRGDTQMMEAIAI